MHDWLSHRAVVSPDVTALVASDTDSSDSNESENESETYSELDETVGRIAARLAAFGITDRDHVGLLVSSRPAAVRLVHATMRLGAVVVPLSPKQTQSERAPRIDHADLDLLVCERAVIENLDTPVRSIDALGADSSRQSDLISESDSVSAPDWEPTDPLVMLYTSGTTGRPKLVVLTVMNVFASAVASAERLGVRPDDRWCSPLAVHHMGGLAPIYRAVIDGTCLVLAPTDTEPLLAALREHGVTGVSLVPVVLDRLLSVGVLPDSLRTVLLGGAPASDALIERCDDRDVSIYPTYGMTEAASQITTARPDEAIATPGTVGRPLFSTTITIIDDDGHPLPTGESGEIVVSGPTITSKYYQNPGATRNAFCSHGFRTGDVGYLDEDHRLWVEGRASDRIVTGGKTVDPREVSGVLRDHPSIVDAAVVGLPDTEWGERVGALIERGTADFDFDFDRSVESHCRARLSAHKRPRVVAYETIPRTESGTIDREAVRARLEEGRT